MTVRLHSEERGRTPRDAGYSLLELLVVLAILGLLVAIAAPRVIGYLESSKVRTAQIQMAEVATALDIYRLDTGDYPSESQGLHALLTQPGQIEGWHGPYLTRAGGIVDPWGHPYIYKRPEGAATYQLSSLGADGQEGGEDDDADIPFEGSS
jgi:general secretion pathway protein G